MTDIRKSDAQFDAEASAPPLPLAPRLALHRLLARQDMGILKLHQRDGDFGIGLPFSHPFERFLDGIYGVEKPWMAGLKALRVECRRSHSDHWTRPEWRGSLCHSLVAKTCVLDVSWTWACFDLYVDPAKTEPVMQNALRRIEQKLTELQARASEVVASDSGRNEWWASKHVHHVVPGLHREDCRQCQRETAA
jgi:hypothetical protein